MENEIKNYNPDSMLDSLILKNDKILKQELSITNILEDYPKDIFESFNINNRQVLKKIEGIELPKSTEKTEDGKDMAFVLNQCKKRFLDLMTSLVAKEVCFNDKNQEYINRFQLLVNNVFEKNIGNYIQLKNTQGCKLDKESILFLYKGGTTMKILYKKYEEQLKNDGFENFFINLIKEFERSDSDYSILINPNINEKNNGITFERVYYDINIISYKCLSLLKSYFEHYPNHFVPLNLINDDIILKKIDEMNDTLKSIKENNSECTNIHKIKKFIGINYFNNNVFLPDIDISSLNDNNFDSTFISNKEHTLENIRIKKFIELKSVDSRVSDFAMSITNNNNKYYRKLNKNVTDHIYISLNESNEYDNNGILAYFSLHRIKINFVAYYITEDNKIGFFDCPSELVDVSILKKQASGLPLFFEHVENEYKVYNYESSIDLPFSYSSYSIFGHINDLIFTLFDVSPYPWDDAKYKKRIRRLIFFVILELVINIKRKSLLKQVIVNFKTLNYYGSELDTHRVDFDKMLQLILNILNEQPEKDKLASLTFFNRIYKLTREEYLQNETNKAKKFFEGMKDLMSLIVPAELNLADYEENTDLNFLGGDSKYYIKYLKYKTKYLKLKKNL